MILDLNDNTIGSLGRSVREELDYALASAKTPTGDASVVKRYIGRAEEIIAKKAPGETIESLGLTEKVEKIIKVSSDHALDYYMGKAEREARGAVLNTGAAVEIERAQQSVKTLGLSMESQGWNDTRINALLVFETACQVVNCVGVLLDSANSSNLCSPNFIERVLDLIQTSMKTINGSKLSAIVTAQQDHGLPTDITPEAIMGPARLTLVTRSYEQIFNGVKPAKIPAWARPSQLQANA